METTPAMSQFASKVEYLEAELRRERLKCARMADAMREKDETKAALVAIEAQQEAERELSALRQFVEAAVPVAWRYLVGPGTYRYVDDDTHDSREDEPLYASAAPPTSEADARDAARKVLGSHIKAAQKAHDPVTAFVLQEILKEIDAAMSAPPAADGKL